MKISAKRIITTLLSIISLFSFTNCAKPSKGELALFVEHNKEFKVLQFADLHFGVEGTAYHNADVERTLAFIDFAIKSEQPDFIVLLGDNMMSQGTKGAQFVLETFDKYEIPYTFVFGNHDAETYQLTYSKWEVSQYLEDSASPYLLYKSGYVEQNGENRYGNFSISVRDTTTRDLLGAFVILDTGVYDYQKAQYQSITEGQINWYKQEIQGLNAAYQQQSSNTLSTIPSITYGHIQLPEYSEAYQKAQNNDGAEFIYYEDLSAWAINSIPSDAGKINYGFFDAMKEMQSSKAYLCGHMHGLNFHVKMDGIILGFCPQSGVTNTAKKTISTFSYTLNEGFDMNLKLVVEPKNA